MQSASHTMECKEVNTRIVMHLKDMVIGRISNFIIRTVNTDLGILAIVSFHCLYAIRLQEL